VREWALITHTQQVDPAEPEALNGAQNMAVDHALADAVRDGGPAILRLYRWKPACLSLGRNQSVAGVLNADRARELGIDVVRRPTGGMAVWHEHELTYCVAAPVAVVGSPRLAYRRINEALLDGLAALGVRADLGTGAVSPRAAVCFAQPAPGEVVAAGRKLIGSAQRCERGVILQHGSILLDGDQSIVARIFGGTAELPGTVKQQLGRMPAWPDLESAITRAFERTFGIRLAPARLDFTVKARVSELAMLYVRDEWTWRT
jgi:lipoate-protein ligase A